MLRQFDDVTAEDMKDVRADSEKQLAAELRRREVLAELWPGAPAACWISARFVRPFSEYGTPPAQVQAQRQQRADWPAQVPHSSLGCVAPLDLPQVELLRGPRI
ncbi:hypothetical protein [Deinococcus humi]|uniref:Uncharacterized protein n=1 Tax=Deinococcus humi TaxID=662880 RepID=A0A7W8JX79_9DEIO|nr:hypothetical protein [Deinococcus humi]MBB5364493.1 hypothetical protein [Deinococcus humi]GGO32917.1 hypothetical protein GCM10008949_31280 [Deinococcus humi]